MIDGEHLKLCSLTFVLFYYLLPAASDTRNKKSTAHNTPQPRQNPLIDGGIILHYNFLEDETETLIFLPGLHLVKNDGNGATL